MKPNEQKIDINELIFRYKWVIGSLLLLAIIVSGGYLLWKENKAGTPPEASVTEQVLQMESKINDQDARIQALESKIAQSSSNSQSQTSGTAAAESGQVAGAESSSVPAASAATGKVNLNTASMAQLDTLPGIGAVYAQRIIDYRNSHAGFKDISELKNIKGIGDKTFDKLKDLVTI